MSDTLRLYHAPSSPNSRRLRIFLAEKGMSVPLVAVDLAKGEQHAEAYPCDQPASRRADPRPGGCMLGCFGTAATGGCFRRVWCFQTNGDIARRVAVQMRS